MDKDKAIEAGVYGVIGGAILYVIGGAGAFLSGVSAPVFGTIGTAAGIMLGLSEK